MKGKLKKFFSGRNLSSEISGSFDGDAAAHDSLLGSNKEEDDWDAWSIDKKNDDASDPGRGRLDRRAGTRRSHSERPSRRKRSKSEVSKRLKRLEGDFMTALNSSKKKFSSKSVGGVFKGKSSDVRSRIDSLALERSTSDSAFDTSNIDRSKSESNFGAKSTKKLRGGRRKSMLDEPTTNNVSTRTRTRSLSRGRRSLKADDREGSSSMRSFSKARRSGSKKPSSKRSISKPRKSKSTQDFPELIQRDSSEGQNSVSTMTKESKQKKKKKKDKNMDKDKDERKQAGDDFSVPSKVEMNGDCESQGSITMHDSIKPEEPTRSKKGKDKEKKEKKEKKKKKRSKSKSSFPDLPPDDFGDGLEGLAEEFRRSKQAYSKTDSEGMPSGELPHGEDSNYTKVNSMFESAWTGMESGNANGDSRNPFEDEKKHNTEDDILRQAVDFEVKQADTTNEKNEEILRLQQELSAALQKQLKMSEEHIEERNEFMQVSRDLDRLKVELAESQAERGEVMEELKQRDEVIENDRNRIADLEQAIDDQLGKEEELVKNLHHSEEEIEHLLEEIQKFEKKLDNGETDGGGASFVELRNTKKELTDREEEVVALTAKIGLLENELKESLTVPQLQIEELDQENKALQGRLKGERLEYTSKLSAKDDIISNLRAELNTFTSSPDAQDLQSARQKLTEAREDATQVREDLARTRKYVEEIQGDREDLVEKYNLLKDKSVFMEKTVKDLSEKSDNLAKKLLVWTEKTYDWKKKAEAAERKLQEQKASKDKGGSETKSANAPGDPQTMFLQAAMEKGKPEKKSGSWGIFKNGSGDQDSSPEEGELRALRDKNLEFEAKIAQLNSDLVKMQTAHKNELYSTKKKIAQLEGENDALVLQNATLSQLSQR